MLPPPKRWKRKYDASINAEDNADDDLDESEDDKPDWHASFNVESRTAGVLRIENVAWVREALHVSTKLRAREVKHVMWWDTQAPNPKREALYALPHLNYTHNTGVVEFSVPPACCLRLALFLDEPSSYDVNGWLVMGGKPYPGYARYPYVHSRLGQVSSVQEVRTPVAARTPVATYHWQQSDVFLLPACLLHRERQCECLARQPATSSWRISQRCGSS